ncbi:MAG: hypothetical protein WC211_00585 [Dehalococcoidia bacterium]
MTRATKWDIRVEPWSGWSIPAEGGAFADVKAQCVMYRPAGTRGRWRKVVVQGALPKDTQALVSQYEASLAKAKRDRLVTS